MSELAVKKGNINDIVESVSSPDTAIRRARLQALEALMLKEEQVEIPVTHRFTGGIYAREITIPKGTLLTGRIHKFDHFDIMLSGDMTVSTDTGEIKRLTGLNIMEGKAGKKRAGFAHEDTHWITFHEAQERDPEEMYEFLTCATFEDLGEFLVLLNNADYALMVSQMGMTEDEIRKQSEEISDFVSLPDSYGHLYVWDSNIEGYGFFSGRGISEGEIICPARIGRKRTQAGKYTNHAMRPNAKMVFSAIGDINLVADKDIEAREEITVDYRDTLTERAGKDDLCQQ